MSNKEKQQAAEAMKDARRRQRLQDLMNEKNQMEAKRYVDYLNTTPFPVEKFSHHFSNFLKIAKSKLCPANLQVPVNAFKELFEQLCDVDVTKLNYMQFGCLSNAMESLPFDLTFLSKESYMALIDEWIGYIDLYQKETSEKKKQIQSDVSKEMEMKLAAIAAQNGMTTTTGTESNKAINPLKPLISEA